MILQWSFWISHRQTEPKSHWEFLQESPKMKTRPNGQKTLSDENFFRVLQKFLRKKIRPNGQKTSSEEDFLRVLEQEFVPVVSRLCLRRIHNQSSSISQTFLLKTNQQKNFTWNGQKVTMSLIPLSANLETICKM